MEKVRGKGTDTLQSDKVFTRKEYIERESALQALCEAVHTKDGNIPCRNQLVSCLWTGTRTQEYAEKILAIPAADVSPVRHGRWVDMGDFISCSLCSATQMKEFWCDYGVAHRLDVRTNYCPNCGARMDGDGDAC